MKSRWFCGQLSNRIHVHHSPSLILHCPKSVRSRRRVIHTDVQSVLISLHGDIYFLIYLPFPCVQSVPISQHGDIYILISPFTCPWIRAIFSSVQMSLCGPVQQLVTPHTVRGEKNILQRKNWITQNLHLNRGREIPCPCVQVSVHHSEENNYWSTLTLTHYVI